MAGIDRSAPAKPPTISVPSALPLRADSALVVEGAPISKTGYPTRHVWTVEEYMKLGDRDVFTHRTELIQGVIYDVASQTNLHVTSVSKSARVLVGIFDDSYWLTIQSTIRLPTGEAPEPDLAVRPGPATGDDSIHPFPLLVIEISDMTLPFDQVVKSSLYAANGIPEYWIVNLQDGHVEVLRKPVPDASRSHGWRYSEPTIVRAPDSTELLSKPGVRIEVAKLLP